MNLCISTYCKIDNRCATLNGGMIFEKREAMSESAFLSALYRSLQIDYPKFFKMDELSKTGFLAAELILRNHDSESLEKRQSTAMLLCNRSSSLQTDEHYQKTIGDEFFPSPSVFVYTLPNIVMGEIAIRHKLFGENTFFVSERFDTETIYTYIRETFSEGKINKALVGWVDFYHEKAQACLMLIELGDEGLRFESETLQSLVYF
jgi:hypothetical protein